MTAREQVRSNTQYYGQLHTEEKAPSEMVG
jgi:hypothetical protein